MNNLQIQIILNSVDKATSPINAIAGRAEALAEKVKHAQKALSGLDKTKNLAEKFKALRNETNSYAKQKQTANNYKVPWIQIRLNLTALQGN